MKMGPSEAKIIEQCKREGQPLPPAIANAPELYDGLDFFLESYMDLNSNRSGETGYIPWTAVKDYCQFYDVDSETMGEMFFHFQAMDDARSEYLQKKQEKQR